MADIKISELGAASAVNAADLFPMTASGVTVKATAQQIKNYIGVGNLSDLDTTDKSSAVVAINEVNTKLAKTEVLISNSGDAYDPSRPYKVGELCIHDNILQRCIIPCSAGSWATNQSCFTQDTLISVANGINEWQKTKGYALVDPNAGITQYRLTKSGNTVNLYLKWYGFLNAPMRLGYLPANMGLDAPILINQNCPAIDASSGTEFRGHAVVTIDSGIALTISPLNDWNNVGNSLIVFNASWQV